MAIRVTSSEVISEMASLRLSLDGQWSVEEFQQTLLTIHTLYDRIAAATTFGQLVFEEERRNDRLDEQKRYDDADYSWTKLYFGRIRYTRDSYVLEPPEPLVRALAAVRPFVSALELDGIRMESPGWIQVLGHLNPLKTIADFISKWRAENTKRKKIDIDAKLAHGKLSQDFVLGIYKQMPADKRAEFAARTLEIAEHVINPSLEDAKELAADSRIIEATIVRPGTPLPNERV
jgi:hypothetical protein